MEKTYKKILHKTQETVGGVYTCCNGCHRYPCKGVQVKEENSGFTHL